MYEHQECRTIELPHRLYNFKNASMRLQNGCDY